MTKKRKADDRQPCPPVTIAPGIVVRAAGSPVPMLRANDGYDAPPRRERKAATGEIVTEIIDMASKPPVTRPLPADPYEP